MRINRLSLTVMIGLLVLGGAGLRETTSPYAGLTGAERLQRTGGHVNMAEANRQRFNQERVALGLDPLAPVTPRG